DVRGVADRLVPPGVGAYAGEEGCRSGHGCDLCLAAARRGPGVAGRGVALLGRDVEEGGAQLGAGVIGGLPDGRVRGDDQDGAGGVLHGLGGGGVAGGRWAVVDGALGAVGVPSGQERGAVEGGDRFLLWRLLLVRPRRGRLARCRPLRPWPLRGRPLLGPRRGPARGALVERRRPARRGGG